MDRVPVSRSITRARQRSRTPLGDVMRITPLIHANQMDFMQRL
ncbi:MAG: hypothetical protein R3F06_09400 [Nitrosomonas sp.]